MESVYGKDSVEKERNKYFRLLIFYRKNFYYKKKSLKLNGLDNFLVVRFYDLKV